MTTPTLKQQQLKLVAIWNN